MSDPGQKMLVEQTLACIFKASAKLADTGERCGCGKPWQLYQEPFLLTQKFVYDIEDDCMRDLYELSCPNCDKKFAFVGDPLEHFKHMAEETKRIIEGKSFDGKYFVRAIGRFGPKNEPEEK